MTNETDEPQEQSWQPPSDYYSQKSEGEPPANSAEQASAEIPPAVASRDGSGQYAGRASAFGTTGPGFAPQAFSLAPKPGIIPLRPLSVMEIISGAFDALRANPRAMFLPSLIVMSILGIISSFVMFVAARAQFNILETLPASDGSPSDRLEEGMPAFLRATGIVGLPNVGLSLLVALVSIILTGLLIVAVSRAVLGRVATPGELWEKVRSRIWPLIGQSLLIGMITFATVTLMLVFFVGATFSLFNASSPSGTEIASIIGILLVVFILALLLSIAAFYFTIRLSFSSAALILENVGVWEGMRRSWQLTKGSFWRVVGILLIAALITSALTGIVSSILGAAGGLVAAQENADAYAAIMAGANFLNSVLQAAILPFSAAVTALTYIDLRMRKEGLDVELRQAAGV